MADILSQIKYPIVLAPMLGVVTPQMVAAVSNAGGLGGLPLGGQPVEVANRLIEETKRLTNQIFAVNLFAHEQPDLTRNGEVIKQMQRFIADIYLKKGWGIVPEPEYKFNTYHDLIDVIIQTEIKVVSFTFGILDEENISKLKSHGIGLIGTATCVEEAIIIEKAGADMVVAQGIEAGGHRGTFIKGHLPQVGLIPLVQQIAESVEIPVIAAGGIHDTDSMKAAFDCGASAVQIGSHFIQADESLATDEQKRILRNSSDISTTLTKGFSGKWARGIRNDFTERVESLDIPDYPIQNLLTRNMRTKAREHGDYEYMSLWAGQNARYGKAATTKEIMNQLIESIEACGH